MLRLVQLMLGKYRLEGKIADGGMGSVFLGRAPDDTLVVLKVPLTKDRDAAIALADEARTGARLRHPAIVETLDFFVDGGQGVLVVAYVDGPTLFRLREAGPLPASAVAEIGVQLASALHAIHTATDDAGRPLQMLHRDISPNNILVDSEGSVRLIDLGIARSADRRQQATLAGMVKGTLRYLAPEILRGGDHSIPSENWALGITLWEAALGRYAMSGDPMNTMRAAMNSSILTLQPGEHIDEDLHEVIAALACPLEQRIQNAHAAAAILLRLCGQKPGGREALAQAVAAAKVARDKRLKAPGVGVLAAHWPDPEAPPAQAPDDDNDVSNVFTRTSSKEQLVDPIRPAPAHDDQHVEHSSSHTLRPYVTPPAPTSASLKSGDIAHEAPTLMAMPARSALGEDADAMTIEMPVFGASPVAQAGHRGAQPAWRAPPAASDDDDPRTKLALPPVKQSSSAQTLVPLAEPVPSLRANSSEDKSAETILLPSWERPDARQAARPAPQQRTSVPAPITIDDQGDDPP